MRLRYAPAWRALGWCYVLLIVLLSLVPNPPDPLEFEYHDKLNHMLGYGLLMYWFGLLYENRRHRLYWALGFILMGVALEFLQGLTPYRQFEWWDMMANAGGVALGTLLAGLPLPHVLHWIETWWLKEQV